MGRTLIIAEAGVNHNGNEQLAMQLIDQAVQAGVDIVKFQTFKTENLVTESAGLADYQKNNGVEGNSQFAMLKKLELTGACYQRLMAYCQQKKITFLSTAFDFDSLDFLVETLQLTTLKIPSGEITNAPFVLAHARTGKNLIVSTGMCTLAEVENALAVIAFGLLNADGHCLQQAPSSAIFAEAFHSEQGQRLLKQKVTLLHCTTDYPAQAADINLRAMDTMKRTFSLPVGYSDHSQGITVPIAAVARGAVVIEKHFTLDKNLPGPDHQASLEPDELTAMVNAIRMVEKALGSGDKNPVAAEIGNKAVARKSLVAGQNIKRGEFFTENNIAIKRPGTGLSPYLYWSLLNRPASKDYAVGDLLVEAVEREFPDETIVL